MSGSLLKSWTLYMFLQKKTKKRAKMKMWQHLYLMLKSLLNSSLVVSNVTRLLHNPLPCSNSHCRRKMWQVNHTQRLSNPSLESFRVVVDVVFIVFPLRLKFKVDACLLRLGPALALLSANWLPPLLLRCCFSGTRLPLLLPPYISRM